MINEILGKIAITPKGQYVAGSYERLDLVTDNGSSYLSLKDNNVSALNVKADWMVVAEKGKAFEYSDFTPEQIALLQKPASDAAGSIALLEGEIEGEEALRVTAETNRNNAEGLRLSAEIIRNDNEADRIEAEGLRASAEISRQTDEGQRVTAESGRVTAESGRVTAENNRATVESGRVTAEGGRVTAENNRATAESGRVTAESVRNTKEGERQTKEAERIASENARIAAGYITSPSAMQIAQLTQAQYDALPVKVATTIYLIIQA